MKLGNEAYHDVEGLVLWYLHVLFKSVSTSIFKDGQHVSTLNPPDPNTQRSSADTPVYNLVI